MKTSHLCLIAIAIICPFIVAICFPGNIHVLTAASMLGVGIVVAGKEIDDITSLDELQSLRNKARQGIGELRDKYKSRADDAKKIAGAWEGAEADEWKRANEDYDALNARIENLRSSEDIEKRWNEIEEDDNRSSRDRRSTRDINNPGRDEPEIKDEHRALALQAWFRCQMDEVPTERQEKACKLLRFNPNRRKLDLRFGYDTEQIREFQNQAGAVHRTQRSAVLKRAMSASTATEGAEFIPQGFMAQLEEALFKYGGIREVVDIWRTASGNTVPWPTASDQDEGEWLAESTESATNADPATANVLFGAHKLGSKVIKVPTELMEDSAFNLANWLPTVLGRRLGRGENRACTTGDGSGKPTGMVNSSTLGHTAAAINAITYQDVVRLEHSVDPTDRMNAKYMFHDTILMMLRLLVDGEGRPLWQPNVQLGIADRFNGREFQINQHMTSSAAATEKPMLFGDFSKYKLREVNTIRIYRLEERFRTADQDGFVAFKRVDGKLVDAGTGPIRHLLMPAS